MTERDQRTVRVLYLTAEKVQGLRALGFRAGEVEESTYWQRTSRMIRY